MTPEGAFQELKFALSQTVGTRSTIHPTRLSQVIAAMDEMLVDAKRPRQLTAHEIHKAVLQRVDDLLRTQANAEELKLLTMIADMFADSYMCRGDVRHYAPPPDM